MSLRHPGRSDRLPEQITGLVGGTVVIVALVVLGGWLSANYGLTSIAPGLASMKANTAIGFVALGSTLVLATAERGPGRTAAIRGLTLAVLGLTFATIAEFLLQIDLGIDELVARDPVSTSLPGRMSVATAIGLALAATGILTATIRAVPPAVTQAFSQASGLIALVALMGYAYGTNELYELGPYATVSLLSAVDLLLVAVASLVLRREGGSVQRLLVGGPGSATIRRLVVPTTIVPIVVGWLVLTGYRAGLYGPALGIGLLVLAIIGVLRVIVVATATAIDRADRERRRSAAREAGIMSTVADAIITIDAASTIRYANAAADRIFGFRPGHLVGRSLTELMPAELVARHRSGVARYLDERIRRVNWEGTELTGRRANGELFPIDVSFSESMDDGDPTFTGAIRDISARKALEAQVAQAQRLESVGRLAGGVAHDFNNILTAIGGFAALLIADLPEGDARRHDAIEIQEGSRRAADLVRQLLAFSGRQVLRPEPTNVSAVVRGVGPLIRQLIGENIAVQLPSPHRSAVVLADPGQLEQIVVNLAVNARDAMPRGGRLSIEVGVVEMEIEDSLRHPGVAPGTHVLLAVSDTGTGMDETTRERIFEPFFTTKGEGRGSGLGLATVHGIVEQSGGHIWVYSEPGRGTTFKVYFPIADDAAGIPDADAKLAAAHPRVAPDTAGVLRPATVLVAEDEPSIRALIELVLGREGLRVLAVGDAEEALALAASTEIDLLVTDVVMPGRSGFELAKALRAGQPHVAVIFMSGYTEAGLSNEAAIARPDVLLDKPFPPAVLVAAVRRALDTRDA
ncbi:MAG: response regulator [Chloroflexi bacterium]|nr:response regulator [Chloroflexota bacterium]